MGGGGEAGAGGGVARLVPSAKLLGVTQPRISDLKRGKIDLFSIDALVEMLARLDVTVTVKTKRAKRVA